MNLQEARKKLPELNGLSDESALNVIHEVYYPGMNKADLANRLGYKPLEAPVPERSTMRAVGDLATQFGTGAVSGVRMMTDMFGADNRVSQGLRSAEEALGGLLSAQAVGDQKKVSAIMQEAEGKGWVDQIALGLKAAGVAPGALLAQAAGTSIPTLAAAALVPGGAAALATRMGATAIGAARVGSVAGTGAAGAIGAAQGAGNIKGTIYEDVKKELSKDPNLTPEQVEARAVEAQSFAGPNAGQIALGGALGVAAGTTGMEKAVAGLRNGVTKAPAGIVGRMAGGGVAEAVPEFAQGGQEKYASNVALNNEGFNVDPMSGVFAQGTMEAAAGFGAGAITGAPKPKHVDAGQAAGDAVLEAKLVPETGPMTRAANVATTIEADKVRAEVADKVLGASLTGNNMANMLQGPVDPLQAAMAMPVDQEAASPLPSADAPIPAGVDAETGEVLPPVAEAVPLDLASKTDEELTIARQSAQDPSIRKALAIELQARRAAAEQGGQQQPLAAADAQPVAAPVQRPTPSGRLGYDKEVEVSAKALQAAFERDSGEPLVGKPEKLEAWRNGTAKTDPASSPIEVGFKDNGKFGINDGRHRVALAAERGENVKVMVDGKDADRLKALHQVSQPAPTGGTSEEGAGTTQPPQAAPEFVKVGMAQGGTVHVKKVDLDGARVQLPMYTADGKRKGGTIHRENLDPTGEKLAASEAELADNPLFDVVTRKGGETFATKMAAQRELNVRGMAESHEVVPGDGGKGFIGKRKGQVPADVSTNVEKVDTLPERVQKTEKTNRVVGKNQDGKTLTEDDRGVRSIADRGFIVNEPVRLQPTSDSGISTFVANRRDEFKTVEELAVDKPAAVASDKPATVNLPPEVSEAIQSQLRKQNSRISRLTSQANAPEMTLEQKLAAQTKVKAAEATQRKMRTGSFDAEDAAAKALDSGNPADFAEHADLFPDAAALIAERAKAGAEPSPLVKAMNDLAEVRASIEQQGRVADDRLLQRERQLKAMVKELQSEGQNDELDAEMRGYEAKAEKPTNQGDESLMNQFREKLGALSSRAHQANDSKLGARIGSNLLGLTTSSIYFNQKWLDEAIARYEPQVAKSEKALKAASGVPVAKPADPDAEAKAKAQKDLDDALGDLANIFGKNAKLNMLPEQEQALLPVLTKVMDAAFRLGYYQFKAAAKFALDTIRAKLGNEAADMITLDHMQGAYIGMAGKYKDQGASSKRDVISVESLDELTEIAKELPKGENDSTNTTDTPDAARQLDSPSQGALEGTPSEDVRPTEGGGDVAPGADGSGRRDGPSNASADNAGGDSGRSVGADAGAVPVSARGTGATGKSAKKPRLPRTARADEGMGLFGPTGGLTPDTGANPAPNAPQISAPQPTDFTITDELGLGVGGQKTKFKNNVAAIRLLRDLESSARLATPDEQAVLAKYVGWGGLPQAFDQGNADWAKEYAEITALMTPEELAGARQSTRYAHFTSKEIIQDGIYAALKQFGFGGGKTLEAGAGVGNFIGLMPADMRSAGRFTAVEREPFSAAIARQLYPQQSVQLADFTEFKGNDGYFDAAVGNPPFASDAQTDRSGRKHLSGLSLHNYFFAKAIDMLREGGIMAQVVTNSFMDAKGDRARKYMSDRVEFLGAIRLPNSAFAKNANTEVTTDIIFLKKRPDSEVGTKAAQADAKRWLNTGVYTDKNGKQVALNQYFVDNPDMMLGDFGAFGTMYGPDQPALISKPGQDTLAMLKEAVGKLPAGVYKSIADTNTMVDAAIVALKNPSVREGGYFVQGDKLMQRLPDIAGVARGQEVTAETQWTAKTKLGESGFERIKALSIMRGTVRGLIAAEMSDDAASMKTLRATLNEQYDAYRDTHGLINDSSTLRVFDDDPDYPLLASLEHGYTPGIGPAAAKALGIKPTKSTAKKGPIFKQRVVAARQAVQKVDTPADALAVSMAERGKLDAPYIGQLLGMDSEEVLKELSTGEKPLLFRDPATDEYVFRDAYLSGNVRAKLAQAKEAGMFANVTALEAVQPEDVASSEITARLGSPWVPTEIYQAFAESLYGEESKARVFYLPANSSYQVVVNGASEVALSNTWGTPEYSGDALLTAVMNNRSIKVTYRDSDGKTFTDIPATEKANEKAAELKAKFSDWLFTDPDRSEVLTKAYNETNNNYVTRVYDGSNMTFPGKVPDSVIKFRRHQRNAIARIVQDRTALLDHVVGAGKTFTVISGAMELKRTGLARKPMVAVPNHLVKQWAADFYRLYPGANVLTATKKDFEKSNRRKFLAKIATGDWDAVVIAHSSFGFIQPSPEFEAEFNEREIKKIMTAIQSVEADDSEKQTKKRTIKQLEGMKERLQNRIRALRDKPMDDLLDFEQSGVDQLFVDEAHMFKNLMYGTKMQGVAGLNDPSGSQRAYDMYVKTNQVMEKNGRGQGVVFATGTPVSNSLAEMYHMMRYLMPNQMRELGFESFDAWANTYASVEQVWMQSPSGDGFKAQNRMSNFVNTPELLKMFDQVSDTVTMDDIKKAYSEENSGAEFPLPKVKGGRRTPVPLEKSAAQDAYMAEIAERAKAIEKRRGPPQKGDDNILVVMTDARKAAMDIRLVKSEITEREKGGRIDRATDEVMARYTQYDAVKGTQIVFSDLGTPLKHAKKELKEYEALQARVLAGNPDVAASAALGDESAIETMEDSEAAQAELDAKGQDWLGAVQSALRGFSIYDDFKAALIEKGIPEAEIAFIHDYNTDDQKASLFRKVNAGQIRVLMGSTAKLGAGTNVQERLVAEHHLDVPWRPSDVEQREGRIERQGNRLMTEVPNFEVEILAYVTKDTLDMRMWQVQETKLKMINQLRTRKIGREIDNAFEDMELSAGEMQAAATGDINLLEEIQLRNDVKKLEQRRRAYDGQRNDLLSRKRRNAEMLRDLPKKVEAAAEEAKFAAQYDSDRYANIPPFKMNIDGKNYTDAKEAQAVLRAKDEATEEVKDLAGEVTAKKAPLSVTIDGELIKNRATMAELYSNARGDLDPVEWKFNGETYRRRTVIANAIRQAVVDAIADESVQQIGTIGAYSVAVEGSTNKKGEAIVELTLRRNGEVVLSNAIGATDSTGTPARLITTAENLLKSAVQQADYLDRNLARARKESAELVKVDDSGEWPDQAKLDAAREAHKAVLALLKKKDEQPEQVAPEAPKFSRSPATQQTYEARIDALFAGGKANLSGVHLLDKSDVMDLLGLGNMPVQLDEAKVILNQANHPEMTAEVWKKIPEWLENPALVAKSSTVEGRYVITPLEAVQGYPVRIIVEPKGGAVQVHALVNAYAPMSANGAIMEAKRIQGQIRRGDVSYVDTKKVSELLDRSGLQLPRLPSLNTDREKILTEKNLAGYRREQSPTMSRGGAKGVSVELAQEVIDGITARWANAPEVVVIADMQDPKVPQAVRDEDAEQKSQGASGEPEGFFHEGKAYIVAGALKSSGAVMRVLFHESLGHYGLWGTFGNGLTPILQQLAALRRKEVAAKAEQYGLNMSEEADRLTAAEEVLAEMAQSTPEIGFVKRAIAVIRAFLRKHVPGFAQMKLTDADIIQNYILPARAFVERGPGGGPRGGVMLSRGQPQALPNSKNQGGNIKDLSRSEVQAHAKDLGLPARGTTESIAELIRLVSSDPREWTHDEFANIGQHLSFHQMLRNPTDADVQDVLANGLKSGMVDSVGNHLSGAWTWSRGRLSGVPTAVFISGALKYKSSQSPYLAPGNKPLFVFRPEKEQDFYEAVIRTAVRNPTSSDSRLSLMLSRQMSQGVLLPWAPAIESAAFRKWFGDSKVVDAKGKPLVVYKGMPSKSWETGDEITEIRSKNGPWSGFFSSDRVLASKFASAFGEGAIVLPAYLSIENPFIVDAKGGNARDFMFDASVLGKKDYAPAREAIESGKYDGVIIKNTADEGDVFVPKNPEQVKSATGNNGNFDGTNPDIRFSRSASQVASQVRDTLNDTFSHPGKLSWWHKTVGSQYNLAERNPAFKKVFDAAQSFINDVSHYGTEAANMAPQILPKLETLKDLTKSALSAADNKAVSAPVFEATLSWTRDDNGKPVRLVEGDDRKAGIVWTDAELKSQFKLTDDQIGLYREFRAAIDASLDNVAKAQMLREAGKDVEDMREAVMDASDADTAAKLLRQVLQDMARDNPDRADMMADAVASVDALADKVNTLKKEGYAPLSRFGKFTVDAVVDGKREYFGMFETERDANKMAAKLRMEFGKESVAQGTMSQKEFELFQGITPESLELFGNMMGLNSTGDEAQDKAFQTYLKLTKNNRSAMKRMIHRQGIAGYSEDVGRVLAAFVYANARQTSAALHIGQMDEAIAKIPKGEGELKDHALELAEYIKKPREEAAGLRGLLFAQYLGGSVASAMVNFTQPLTVSIPYLSQYGGLAKAGKAWAKAVKDMSQGVPLEAGLQRALKAAEESGVVSPQEVHQLMARARGAATLQSGDGTRAGDAAAMAKNTWTRTALAWGKLFGYAEQVNRRSTFIAAYRLAVDQGIKDPAAFAEKAVNETQFINNKANKMKFGRGAIGATLMTFKSYSLNWLELMHRLSTQDGKEGKLAAAYMLGALFLVAGVGGLPFADDMEDLIDAIAQKAGYNFSTKKQKQEFLEGLFGKAGADFVERGLTGIPGVPIDVSGRMGMANLIPGTGLLLEKRDSTRDVMELAGPAGDMIKRMFQAVGALASGEVGEAIKFAAPTAVTNAIKGADMAEKGMYRDTKGAKVIDTTPGEAIAKMIGFQPSSVSKVQESNFINQRSKDFYNLKTQEIRAKWAMGMFENDPDKIAEARKDLQDWNEDNPDQKMQANMPAIIKKVREMRKDKAQRIADTAPKAMRAQMRADAREAAL